MTTATEAAPAAKLLTAEEYAGLPDDGRRTELIRGVVVEMNVPYPRHGEICCQAAYLLRRFLDDHPLGRVPTNDSGVVTERGPDTVRGADVAYYSVRRLPPGPLPPRGYLTPMPEIVFEVRSPDDRWREMHRKAAEYLTAGVDVVVVLDDATTTAHVYADAAVRVLAADDELTFPALLEGFRCQVRRFFE
jgi:Uma2 family endonuclease